MVDLLLVAQKFNPVDMINHFLPKGMGELIVFLWCIVGVVAVFILFSIVRNFKLIWNMYKAKRDNLVMGIIPFHNRTTSVVLSKEELKEKRYTDGTNTWELMDGTGDSWDNGVRWTLLVPSVASSMNMNQLCNAFRNREEFVEMPTAADAFSLIYTIGCQEAERMVNSNEKRLEKFLPWFVLLVVGVGGLYMLVKSIPPNSVSCVYDIAQTMVATTTTTLPKVGGIG